jgi:hypothetical protein
MRTRKYIAAGALLALSLGAAACDQGITGLNNNPNAPEDVPPGPLFTNAARLGVTRWLGTAYSLRGTEFVAQHFAEVQYPDEDRYTRLTGSSTNAWFTGPYTSELEDLTKIIQKGKAANQPGTYAPAMALKVWGFSYLTDTWGDVPYSEALMGDSVGSPLFPKYDPQQQIYTSFFSTLDEASKALSGASATLGSADPIYQGAPAKWQKFANSLRARLAMRIVNKDPAKAGAELSAAFAAAGGLIETNADNAQLKYPGDGVYNNPWSVNLETRDDHRMSNTLMDILNATNDPRMPVYAMPTEADPSKYLGMPNGLTTPQAYLTTASRIGKIFQPAKSSYAALGGTGANLPAYVITAAEVLFIKAEAAERGLGGLNAAQAKGFYEAAIRASMAQWGVTDAAKIDAFLAKPDVAYKGGVEGQKQIAIQKWIALLGDGGNAWAEWRRTCQPATVKPGPAAMINTVPRRFQYATAEYAANREQLTAAVARQGADEFTTRMWWDSAPTAAPTYVAGCGTR